MIARPLFTALLAFVLPAALVLGACQPRLQEAGPAIRAAYIDLRAFEMEDGASLPYRIWTPWDRPAKGVFVALHGFNDHSGGMAMPGHGLARRGFIVYAYDQRGFGVAPEPGVWAGAPTLIADVQAVARLVKARHPDLPLYLLGESMGGAVILAMMAAPDAPSIDGVVLAAPAIWGRQTMSEGGWAVLEAAANLVPGVTVRPTGVRRIASDNGAALRRLGADPLVIKSTRIDAGLGLAQLMTLAYASVDALGRFPTLLMFGKREGILDRAAVRRFLAELGKADDAVRIAIYPRGYHLLLRDYGQGLVLDDIDAWVEDPVKPLPSGADKEPIAP